METVRVGTGVYHLMQSVDPFANRKGLAYCRMWGDRTFLDSNHPVAKEKLCKNCTRIYNDTVTTE